MGLLEIARCGADELAKVTGLRVTSVIGINADEGGWRLLAELVEKESIPPGMDILARYEARLNSEGCLLGFQRTGLRRRGDTEDSISVS